MKPLFSKQYLLLIIALCIITSCKLTGNFAIVKRQHEKGYYIETPSFVKNSDSRSIHAKNFTKQAETSKPEINNDNDNLIASVNAVPINETAPHAKVITQATINHAIPFNVKFIARDTINKKKPFDNTYKTLNKTSHNDKATDWLTVIAFILLCLAVVLGSLMLFPLIANAIGGLFGFSILSAYIGFILILKDLIKIRNHPEEFKTSFLWLAIIMLILYILILSAS